MILHLTTILVFQLIGETLTRSFGWVVPGPVLGMALLLLFFMAAPRVAAVIQPTAQNLLSHLSLLFVPAGVGIVGHLDRMGSDGPAIFLALLFSTALSIAVGALVFAGIARWMGAEE
ncbi:CidA/LrgA family protein [Granulosicoccus sp. 3-233]|uniref:CidA/LrgA family protein n=1 Tax=Granulosicoccus sp. 3-233 TaxID=3417969 RepID=UPI003D32CE30